MDQALKRICIIQTGGTVGMTENAQGVLQPTTRTEEIISFVPSVKQIANIDSIFLLQLDSSDLNPRHWQLIAKTIADHYEQYDGFVILHGTDTLVYTATVLSFMLGNLGKPVVLTGSLLPISAVASDAQNNLINAIRVASDDIGEVAIMFGSVLLRGNRAKKMHEHSLSAFTSPHFPALATFGVNIRFNPERYRRRDDAVLDLKMNLVSRVAVIKLFPGITNEQVLGMVPPRTEGVIIEAYGSGNIPLGNEGIQSALESIISQDIIVVIGTQCVYGSVEYHRYAGGHFAKSKGALTAQDMTSEAAVTKFMWVLGQTKKYDAIKKLYETNIIGELHTSETVEENNK